MKKKSIAMIALAMLLALSLMTATTAFAGTSNATTEATITFTDGDIEIKDGNLGAGLNDMNIDFGSHTLPTGAQTYTAADGAHTLRVSDARVVAGDWDVTVSMGPFINQTTPSNTFDGIITLESGVTTSTSATQTTLTTASTVTLDSTVSATQQVLRVDAGYSHGDFDTTWAQANIKLSIDAAASAAVQINEIYQATMTWTLTWA